MSDDFAPDDDLHYEDFDDVGYPEPADELDVIDLDLADEASVETPPVVPPVVPPVIGHIKPQPPVAPHARRKPPVVEKPHEEASKEPPAAPAEELAPPLAAEVEMPEEEVRTQEVFPSDEAQSELPLEVEQEAIEAEPEAPESAAFTWEETAPADLIGCVLLALPPDFAAEVQGLRETSGVADLPSGVVLAGPFRAPNLPALEGALDAWARAHLPLPIETASVVAEVIEAQRYVAAWALQPADRLRRAAEALHRALAPLVEYAEAAPRPAVRLVVGDYVPPDRYPRLIARMQRAFEPQAWQASTLALAQRDAGGLASRWAIVWVSRS